MGAALFRPLTGDDQMSPANAEAFIKPNAHFTAHERLEIYARQYWFRLLDCLHDDYPGLRALLGQKRFHSLCRAYLAAHPSSSWTLRNLGSQLESFIQSHPQLAGPRAAAAIDIVRFEWAQVVAFDEARRKPLPIDDLLGVDPSTLTLGLQPYLSLIALDYAVDDYFMAVRDADAGLRSEASNAQLEARQRTTIKRVPPPRKQALWLAVHRCENDIYFKRIDREAFLLLTQLREGNTLGTAIECALANASPAEDWPTKLRDWFQSWSALGWFCA
jgi:hypothetical protein